MTRNGAVWRRLALGLAAGTGAGLACAGARRAEVDQEVAPPSSGVVGDHQDVAGDVHDGLEPGPVRTDPDTMPADEIGAADSVDRADLASIPGATQPPFASAVAADLDALILEVALEADHLAAARLELRRLASARSRAEQEAAAQASRRERERQKELGW